MIAIAILRQTNRAGRQLRLHRALGHEQARIIGASSRSEHDSFRSDFCCDASPDSVHASCYAAAVRMSTKRFDSMDSTVYVLTVIGIARKGFMICSTFG